MVWKIETTDAEVGDILVSLFLLFLLAAARRPSDPRLAMLLQRLRTLPDSGSLREQLAGSLRADHWERLVNMVLPPLHQEQPALSTLLAAIGFPR